VSVAIKGRLPGGAWSDSLAAHVGERLMALERELAGRRAQSVSPQHDPTTPTSGGSGPPAVLPTHTHHADAILYDPYGDVVATRVGPAIDELSDEKLARDGSQTMLGALDMNHFDVANADDIDAEGTVTVAEDVTLTGAAGLANVSGLRRARFVAATVAGVDYAAAEGDVSWDTAEGTQVAYVESGSSEIKVARGWDVVMARARTQATGGFAISSSTNDMTPGGYAAAPDIQVMIANAIVAFCGAGPKRVWNSTPGTPAGILAYLTGLGHTITTAGPAIVPSVANYDFLLTTGNTALAANPGETVYDALWSFVLAGGGVFSRGNFGYSTFGTKVGHLITGIVYNPSGAGLDYSCQPVGSDAVFSGVGAINLSDCSSLAVAHPALGRAGHYHVTNDQGLSAYPQILIWRPDGVSAHGLVIANGVSSGLPIASPWLPAASELPALAYTHGLLGITMTDAAGGERVAVMRRGILRGVVEQNSEAWAVGDLLWGSSDGSLTKTRPTAPLPQVYVGKVFADEGAGGPFTVAVDVRVIPSLYELSGVKIEALADKDLPFYDAATSTAIPRQATEADLALSDITTNDVTTARHGLAPKAPNDAAKYLDGTGAWSQPNMRRWLWMMGD
jgi:hypothetical protein